MLKITQGMRNVTVGEGLPPFLRPREVAETGGAALFTEWPWARNPPGNMEEWNGQGGNHRRNGIVAVFRKAPCWSASLSGHCGAIHFGLYLLIACWWWWQMVPAVYPLSMSRCAASAATTDIGINAGEIYVSLHQKCKDNTIEFHTDIVFPGTGRIGCLSMVQPGNGYSVSTYRRVFVNALSVITVKAPKKHGILTGTTIPMQETSKSVPLVDRTRTRPFILLALKLVVPVLRNKQLKAILICYHSNSLIL